MDLKSGHQIAQGQVYHFDLTNHYISKPGAVLSLYQMLSESLWPWKISSIRPGTVNIYNLVFIPKLQGPCIIYVVRQSSLLQALFTLSLADTRRIYVSACVCTGLLETQQGTKEALFVSLAYKSPP